MPIIETQNLTKIWANRVIALNGVNLTVEPGRVFGLLGPNGAGKTTLLKLLLGLQTPTAGVARMFGVRVTPNAAGIRQRVGYLPTNPRFPPTMTPITYLDLVGQLFGMGRQERKPRLASLIRAVDLLGAASRPIKGFSTGMMTRLGIAASLMNDPELLLWDEPTAGLDPAGRKYTLDLIRELGRAKTILVSSHILSDIDRVCEDVGVLHDGKLIYCGSVRDLKRTLARNDVDLEVDGDDVLLDRWVEAVSRLPAVLRCERTGDAVNVLFEPAAPLAATLGAILACASEMGVTVHSVVTTKGQTEEAFLRLLEVDQSHGFQRAYGGAAPVADGVGGAAEG